MYASWGAGKQRQDKARQRSFFGNGGMGDEQTVRPQISGNVVMESNRGE